MQSNSGAETHNSALIEAATWDHFENLQLLIDARADVNIPIRDWYFRYPLSSALSRAASHANYRCVEKLLSSGADVNVTPTPILVDALAFTTWGCRKAFERSKMDYIPENHSHSMCVKLLIQAGANVNMKAVDGSTPLLHAARNDHDDCVDLLIQAGAIVNDDAIGGKTATSQAAFYGSTKSLQKLLTAGADVNSSRELEPALVECVWNSPELWDRVCQNEVHFHLPRNFKQTECVEMLINAGSQCEYTKLSWPYCVNESIRKWI